MWRGAANEEGRDLWESWDIMEGRKVVSQDNDGKVDSLTACYPIELGLLLMNKYIKVYIGLFQLLQMRADMFKCIYLRRQGPQACSNIGLVR